MLSICVVTKNRSRVKVAGRYLYLFPNFIRSIVESVQDTDNCELVVADFESDDCPLSNWLLQAAAPLSATILSLKDPFSRGRGRNAAAAHARGDDLFFLDADTLVSPELLDVALQHVKMNKAYFPILFSFDTPDHTSGSWAFSGYGQCLIKRETYERAGRWPEFKSWGQEDEDFFLSVSRVAKVVREKAAQFYHQWHPNSLMWKNRYGLEAPRLGREGERMRRACEELTYIIPPEAMFILVDESQFCIPQPPLERSIPFLERNGVYWGLPPDNATAIRELSRLRYQGAKFIVFAWMCFWWLDHYDEFHDFLRSTYRCILKTSRLIVFDLGGNS